jgi:hypothetical protein
LARREAQPVGIDDRLGQSKRRFLRTIGWADPPGYMMASVEPGVDAAESSSPRRHALRRHRALFGDETAFPDWNPLTFSLRRLRGISLGVSTRD